MSVIYEEMGVRLLGQKTPILIEVQLKKIEHGRGVMIFQYSRDMMFIIRKYGEIEFWNWTIYQLVGGKIPIAGGTWNTAPGRRWQCHC